MQKGKIIILMGLPASGKSTTAESIMKSAWLNDHKPILYCSLDATREQLYGTRKKLGGKKVFKKTMEELKLYLSRGATCIYDATNLTKKTRARVLQALTPYYETAEIIFLNTPYETCLVQDRNRKFEHQVGQKVIQQMSERIELPSADEGFAQITIIE